MAMQFVYVLHKPLMFILVLQGYDSIPAEVPDPKAKEVCLLPKSHSISKAMCMLCFLFFFLISLCSLMLNAAIL